MTTLVWSRKGACVKVRDAAAPRAPPFVALSARRADLLEWKEGRVHQEDVAEEGEEARPADRGRDTEALRTAAPALQGTSLINRCSGKITSPGIEPRRYFSPKNHR